MTNTKQAHLLPSRDKLIALYDSGLSQREIAIKYKVTEHVVQRAFVNLGIPTYKTRQKTGVDSVHWKAGLASYAQYHSRVQKVRGTPSWCAMCERTDRKRYEWASVSRKYADTTDYIRLCKSCHHKFDRVVDVLYSENTRVTVRAQKAAARIGMGNYVE